MTTCPYEPRIQAYLDGEWPREERKALALHLESCADCRAALLTLKRLGDWTDQALQEAFAMPAHAQDVEIDVDAAWAHFETRVAARTAVPELPTTTRGRWTQMAKSYKKWLVGTAAAAVLFGSLAIPQVQAAADDLLSMFRVEKFATIQISQQDLRDMQNWIASGKAGEKDLQGLGKVWSDDEKRDVTMYKSMEQAQAAGFQPSVPQGYSMDFFTVKPDYTLHFQLNTDRANALLKQFGSDVAFDPNLNDKDFSIEWPQTLHTSFTSSTDPNQHFSYAEFNAPQMNVPKGVDLNQLRATILKLPMLPEHIRQQLASIDDWQKTLPVPTVEGAQQKATKTTVNGADGLYSVNGKNATLFWQKDGRVHLLESDLPQVDDKTQDTLQALAKSLN